MRSRAATENRRSRGVSIHICVPTFLRSPAAALSIPVPAIGSGGDEIGRHDHNRDAVYTLGACASERLLDK